MNELEINRTPKNRTQQQSFTILSTKPTISIHEPNTSTNSELNNFFFFFFHNTMLKLIFLIIGNFFQLSVKNFLYVFSSHFSLYIQKNFFGYFFPN